MSEKMPWGLKTEKLTPGGLKGIPENKLKSFNIGAMNVKKGTTKKEMQEKRMKMEQEETEHVFREFVESFDDASKGLNKSWVKGGLATDKDTPSKKPESTKLYKPTSKLAELASTFHAVKELNEDEKLKPKKPGKKKTNLELFKEELKVIQEERMERRKVKQQLGIGEEPSSSRKTRFDPVEPVATGVSLGLSQPPAGDEVRPGAAYNYGDEPQTTNLYLGNINPKMTEQQLCEVFGRYGPLASVKIMWPRSDEERSRGRNCGFVAFMNRKDGERALENLQNKDVQGYEMKLGWGKAVPIPPHPVYIPPALAELSLPPPPSGLPFNAQALRNSQNSGKIPPPVDYDSNSQDSMTNEQAEDFEKILANAVVKVVIPTERSLLSLIHRMIEFVVREGPMFEAMIMNREISNPQYRFLFENRSPAHLYYRWKLFSVLQGDDPYRWKTEEFVMFKNGSLWRPPRLNPYTQGMPDELVSSENTDKRGQLSESQRDRLEDLLRDMSPERSKIADAMVWCLDHAESAEEVVDCISESLSILQTPMPKKIARLFLVSDILHNSCAKVPNASFFRKFFERRLPDIFKDLHEAYENIDARLKAESFKQKVITCFRAWEEWAIYPNELLIRYQNIFLGLAATGEYQPQGEADDEGEETDVDGAPIFEERPDDLDGQPIGDEDLDGVPVSGEDAEQDVDGVPLDTSAASAASAAAIAAAKFKPSKWESVDKSLLEAQAVTTSKWDAVEEEAGGDNEDLDGHPIDDGSDHDGVPFDAGSQNASPGSQGVGSETSTPLHSLVPYGRDDSDSRDSRLLRGDKDRAEMSEERRAKLREIEVKVVKYQDELEAGKRTRKPEISLSEQVEHYRRKLLSKEDEKERDRKRDRKRGADEIEKSRERGRDRDYKDLRDQIRSRQSDKRERRRDRSSSSDEDQMEQSMYRSSVDSPRLPYRIDHPLPSPSTPASYRDERSPKRARRRSRSPKKPSRAESPRRTRRSRSRSRSPSRHRHKHKKSRH